MAARRKPPSTLPAPPLDAAHIRGTVERIEIAVTTKVNRDEVESIVHTVLGRA